MIYVEILEQEINQRQDDFRDCVKERINIVTRYNPKNIISIQWLKDNESYYPYICILTYYKEMS